jgi:hypothetical protein
MRVGIVMLGGANHDMIYVDYSINNKNLPKPSIPVFSYDSTSPEVISKRNLIILDAFTTSNYIVDEEMIILVCKVNNNFTPYPSFGNSKGFVCAELLFSREFAKRLSPDDKNKIREHIKYLNLPATSK